MSEDHFKTLNVPMSPKSIQVSWDAPALGAMQALVSGAHHQNVNYRLFRLNELGEGKAAAYRLAMENVVSSLSSSNCATVYILSGQPEGVSLYLGVASRRLDVDIHEAARQLQTAFEGNFLGSTLTTLPQDDAVFQTLLAGQPHLGCVLGVPSFNEEEHALGDEDFQGIERLANSLSGERWQLVLVAEPGQQEDIHALLEQLYDFSTDLSAHAKSSVQQSTNSGWNRGDTTGENRSVSKGTSTNKSASDTRGDSDTRTAGKQTGVNQSHGTSTNEGKSGSSWSSGEGKNTSKGTSTGANESRATGTSTSHSDSTSKGTSDTKTEGSSTGTSKGTSGGDSVALTREHTNKRVEEMQKHISDTQIQRFRQGLSKGMFRTAIYLGADTEATYQRLSRSVLSIFQGNQANMTPLRAQKLTTPFKNLGDVLQIWHSPQPSSMGVSQRVLAHSMSYDRHRQALASATWLNTEEIALLAGLPSRELPGLKIRKSVDFALNTSQTKLGNTDKTLALGNIIQHGRTLPNSTVNLPMSELNKHVFVTGVTGSGKTTTCMKLLVESGLPFAVLEPAKTEYRALHGQGVDVCYYALGREDLTTFRLNPFELVSKDEHLSGHIQMLRATLSAVFPMEAAMPYLVEEAIIQAYEKKGWEIQSGKNFLSDDPWAEGQNVWPIFSDMIAELEAVIKSKGMGKEFEEKYLGSLVARLSNLTLGTKGRMLNTPVSINFDALLDKRVVIELEELKDEQDKALFMGLIISRLAECMKHRHRRTPSFQHLTLVEEAHRLLSRPEPGESDAKKQGVEIFANLLAEVRKYGEGLIIADQIPNKLLVDVIKNTNTKIVHRLFAADDRKTIGDSMGLTDDQQDFLPLLQAGEVVMYCGGWHGAVRVAIKADTQTDRADIPESEIKRKGSQQLWADRTHLLPHLAPHIDGLTPEGLAHFVYAGRSQLVLFLKLLKLCRSRNPEQDHVTQLHARFMRDYATLQAALPCDAAQLLAYLLLDCTSNLSRDVMMWIGQEVPAVLMKLATSTEAINGQDLEASGRPQKAYLDLLCKIKAI